MSKPHQSTSHNKATGSNPYIFSVLAIFLLTIAITALLKIYSPLNIWLSALAAINLAAFILCGYDKGIASTSATRVPEIILFGAGLCGGSLGLIIGMTFFRHKTQKSSFQLVIGIIVVIQLLAFRYIQMHPSIRGILQ